MLYRQLRCRAVSFRARHQAMMQRKLHESPFHVGKIENLQRPGIEPGPPAWQARILPLNQRCLSDQGKSVDLNQTRA